MRGLMLAGGLAVVFGAAGGWAKPVAAQDDTTYDLRGPAPKVGQVFTSNMTLKIKDADTTLKVMGQTVKLKQRLSRPHALNGLVYRITLADDRAPAKAFAQDNRQTARPAKGQTVEVEVKALRGPPEKAPPGAAAVVGGRLQVGGGGPAQVAYRPSSEAKPFTSIGLPNGSRKNIVHCSPG